MSETKIADFSETILERSIYLLRQADAIASNSQRAATHEACSASDLDHLRSLLWNYQLIKDIGRVKPQGIICSVMLGKLAFAIPLSAPLRDAKPLSGATLMHLSVASGIQAAALQRDDLIIFLSPFAFSRFENDARTAAFNAIVVNHSEQERYFSVGESAPTLSRIYRGDEVRWRYVTEKRCSADYDLCVIAGAEPASIFTEPPAIISAVALGALIIGSLISLGWYCYRNKKRSLPARLRRALVQDKLCVVYQPVFEIASGAMTGMEALLRWQDEDIGFISPEVFIPLAEEQGLMRQLTEYVTEKALRETRDLIMQHGLVLSINVSLADLFSTRYLKFLREITQRLDVPASSLMLEITERQGANINSMSVAITRFKNAGFLIALDDFGTGYSNISWLSRLPVDEIKIDKSISDSIGTDSLNQTLLINLIILLKSMPQKVVFEGLEKQVQIDYLQTHFSCCYGQGWWYAKPANKEELVTVIQQKQNSSPVELL